jgi:hypothetical protein
MDLLWYGRYRNDGGGKSFASWEFSTDAGDFGDAAPAPARVGKLVAGVIGVDLDDSSVGPTNNVVHWMAGVGWGTAAGIADSVLPVRALRVGVATGVTAWATSYAVLGRLGIYQPITEYDKETLWKDLSAHLVFGVTMGLALGALDALRRR